MHFFHISFIQRNHFNRKSINYYISDIINFLFIKKKNKSKKIVPITLCHCSNSFHVEFLSKAAWKIRFSYTKSVWSIDKLLWRERNENQGYFPDCIHRCCMVCFFRKHTFSRSHEVCGDERTACEVPWVPAYKHPCRKWCGNYVCTLAWVRYFHFSRIT